MLKKVLLIEIFDALLGVLKEIFPFFKKKKGKNKNEK